MGLQTERGFSLIEALTAVALVAVVVLSVGFGLGMSASDLREQREELRSSFLLAGKMAELEAAGFAELNSGADTLTVDGTPYPRYWEVTRHDGDGDTVPDFGLLLITVRVGIDTCQTLRADYP